MMETHRRELLLDTQVALKIGQTVEQYRSNRERSIEKWTKLFHAEMEKWNTDDPLQVLPAMLAKIEEAALAAARAETKKEAAKVARELVKTMFRKALL